MKEIPLTRGYRAIVDDDDYERLSAKRWRASVMKPRADGSVTVYAIGSTSLRDGKERTLFLHRVVLDAPKGKQVDHINGDGLDNRKENLRICTNAENNRNRRPYPYGDSKFKGVSWAKRDEKWRATIKMNGKRIHLGYFTREIDAANAYDAAAIERFGEFARTNNARAAFAGELGEVEE